MHCLVQARVSSKRLPNKIFMKIGEKMIISRVIEQLRKSKKINRVTILTSKNKSDEKIVKYCKKNKVFYFRGSLNNVALRFLNASKKLKAKAFVRISCDSPFINFQLVDKIINNYKKKSVDIVTNIFPRSFPKGQSVEVINTKILRENIKKFSKHEMEHVTPFFYKNSKNFKIFNLKSKKNFSKLKLSVDTKKDFLFLNKNLKYQKLKYL